MIIRQTMFKFSILMFATVEIEPFQHKKKKKKRQRERRS